MSPPAVPAGQPPLQMVPEPPSSEGGPFGRIVAFLAIVAVAALWLQHHIGFEFEKLGVIAIATAIWGVMGKVADWVGEKSANLIYHDLAGWLMMPMALLLLWGELSLMSVLFVDEEPIRPAFRLAEVVPVRGDAATASANRPPRTNPA